MDLPSTASGYEILERLGKKPKDGTKEEYYGIRAAVFKVRVRHDSKKVETLVEDQIFAMKIMAWNKFETQEYQLLEKIPQHKNIIKMHSIFHDCIDFGAIFPGCLELLKLFPKEQPRLFMVMDLYKWNLWEFSASFEFKVPEHIVLDILVQIFSGVKQLNSHGYVHRDLKPDNILVSTQNQKLSVAIADFGTHLNALKLHQTDKQMRNPKGSTYLRPPEVLFKLPPYNKKTRTTDLHEKSEDNVVDFSKADLYAVARICYEVFVPYGRDTLPRNFNCISWKPEQVLDLPGSYSFELKRIIKSLILPDPVNRPTVDNVIESLQILQGRTNLSNLHSNTQ